MYKPLGLETSAVLGLTVRSMSLASRVFISLVTVCLTWLSAVPSATGQQQSLRQPMVNTPLTRSELLTTLRDAHREAYGSEPSRNRLAMAWAQVAGENLHGKLIYNRNLGNVGPYRPDQPYYVVPADHHRYRHFNSFIEGAKAYWATVRHCTAAIRMFDDGNAPKAAEYLRNCGYYEAELDVYSRTMKSLYWFAMSTVIPEEERERREKERQAREQADYDLRHQFTPICLCSRW